MSEITQAERYLLDQIRQGEPDGWSQMVDRYQGRLLAFARSKLRRSADADDLVQETFLAMLKGLARFRHEVGLETYLFIILRRKIVDYLRGRRLNVCLLQDTMRSDDGVEPEDAFAQVAGADPTASWYARRDEQQDQQRKALAEALRELIKGFRNSLNFRDLQIVEMVFYCQLPNNQAAQIAGVGEQRVGLIKHRCLKRIRERVGRVLRDSGPVGPSDGSGPAYSDQMLTEVWESQRLSCPKRSTIGAYLLETLDQGWYDYVDFHINRLGCRFCRANLDDLRQATTESEQRALRERILESTVGFLRKS